MLFGFGSAFQLLYIYIKKDKVKGNMASYWNITISFMGHQNFISCIDETIDAIYANLVKFRSIIRMKKEIEIQDFMNIQ